MRTTTEEDRHDILYLSRLYPLHVPIRPLECRPGATNETSYAGKVGERWQSPRWYPLELRFLTENRCQLRVVTRACWKKYWHLTRAIEKACECVGEGAAGDWAPKG